MSKARMWIRLLVAMLVAGLCAACDEEDTRTPPIQRDTPPPKPRVLLEAERGVISAAGGLSEDVLTVSSTVDGTVRLTFGDCEGPEIEGEASLAGGERKSFTVSADGPLAHEGEHVVSACFTDDHGQRARSAISLRVDNTPPTVVPTLAPGGYCGRQFVGFYCTDCTRIAYDFDGDVAIDSNGKILSGSRYLGVEIPIAGNPTLYYRGMDRAGNVSDLSSATYSTEIGTIEVVGIDHEVISDNWESTQREAAVTIAGEPGSTFHIRRGATCNAGTIVESGVIEDEGTGTVSVHAFSLLDGDNEMRVCALSPVGCAMEAAFTLARKDASLGWTLQPTQGTGDWPACEAEAFFGFVDADVTTDGATAELTLQVSTSATSPPYVATIEDHGVRVALVAPCLPEGARIDFDVTVDGIRDEAGNPLPAVSTWAVTDIGNDWLPVGERTFEVDGDVAVDQTTGLVWQRCVRGQAEDCAGSAATATWGAAHQYCYGLGAEAFAGRDDWRLPTARELASLLDPEMAGVPAYLPPDLEAGGAANFWTATRPDQYAAPWVIDFSDGRLHTSSLSRAVRCVAGRAEEVERTLTRGRFENEAFVEDATGPVVHDPAGDLFWEQAPRTASWTSTEADDDACTGILHDAEGWRLPSAAHFASLIHLDGLTPHVGRLPFSVSLSTTRHWLDPVSDDRCFVPSSGDVVLCWATNPAWCVHEGNFPAAPP